MRINLGPLPILILIFFGLGWTTLAMVGAWIFFAFHCLAIMALAIFLKVHRGSLSPRRPSWKGLGSAVVLLAYVVGLFYFQILPLAPLQMAASLILFSLSRVAQTRA